MLRVSLAVIVFALILVMPFSHAQVFCQDGDTRECGIDVGICKKGVTRCVGGVWLDKCEGEVKPINEICGNGLDDNCDGQIDNCGDPFMENLSYVMIASGASLVVFAMIVSRIQGKRERKEEQEIEDDEDYP